MGVGKIYITANHETEILIFPENKFFDYLNRDIAEYGAAVLHILEMPKRDIWLSITFDASLGQVYTCYEIERG